MKLCMSTSKKSGVRTRGNLPTRDQIQAIDDVTIAVTQAFCPEGHNLVWADNRNFMGFAGMKLSVTTEVTGTVNVTLSPIHGHHERHGGWDITDGTRCEVACPTCQTSLPVHEKPCECGDGKLRKIYLTPRLEDADMVLVCDVWGCHRSSVLDHFEMLSEYIEGDEE